MTDRGAMPVAAWRVTLDGKDLTEIMAPRLIRLTLSEKRGAEADQLDIELHDADGLLDIPKAGAVLRVSLGWKKGAFVTPGLVDKGSFRVDEAKWSGPPDRITITARSADFTDSFRIRRERSFVGKTVKEVIGAIAAANKLKPSVDAGLGAKVIPALGHGAKSDAALLKLLGKRFDAVATVKAGVLIFAPIGQGKTASGQALPTETLDRGMTSTIDYARVERDAHDGVEASWHDKASGQRRTVTHGHSGNGKAKRVRKVHASEADAKHAAEAENSRMNRAKANCSLTLPWGRPDLFPDRPIKLTGVKAEIAARKWVISECRHEMDGSGGLRSSLTLEALS
jgi:phage protein D